PEQISLLEVPTDAPPGPAEPEPVAEPVEAAGAPAPGGRPAAPARPVGGRGAPAQGRRPRGAARRARAHPQGPRARAESRPRVLRAGPPLGHGRAGPASPG